MDKYYIYKITNKLNGKSYVGQHKVPQKPESFKRYMGKGIAITKAIKKYGKENFDKIILEELQLFAHFIDAQEELQSAG